MKTAIFITGPRHGQKIEVSGDPAHYIDAGCWRYERTNITRKKSPQVGQYRDSLEVFYVYLIREQLPKLPPNGLSDWASPMLTQFKAEPFFVY